MIWKNNFRLSIVIIFTFVGLSFAGIADFSISRSDTIYVGSQSMTPSVVRAKNGDLVCCYGTTGDAAPGGLCQFVRSTNGGVSWSSTPYLTINSQYGSTYGSTQGYLSNDENGDIILAVMDVYNMNMAIIKIYKSVDNGLTFGTPISTITRYSGDYLIISAGIRILPNGDWILPGYILPESVWMGVPCGFWRSTDSGLTWNAHEVAFADAPWDDPAYKAFNEVDIVVRRNNSLLAVARTDRVSSGFPYSNGQLYYTESFNNGATWTAPQLVGIPGHSPALIRAADNQIVLGCRRLTAQGNKTSIFISENGVNFTYDSDAINPRPHSNSATGYPTFAMLPDGDIYMAYYAADTSLSWPLDTYCAGNLIAAPALPVCGNDGFLKSDLNNDCKVNFEDFALMLFNWMLNTDPDNTNGIDCRTSSYAGCE